MIRRRALLAGASAGLWLGTFRGTRATAIPAQGVLAFDIRRFGFTVGTHTLRFEAKGDHLLVLIDVKVSVGIGPINLFRYRLQSLEQWQAGRFVALESRVNDDGALGTLSARREDGRVRVVVNGSAKPDFPADALPLTHWNQGCLHAPLFNPEDGTPLPYQVTALGRDPVALADGVSIPATRYKLAGKTTLDEWYDDSGVWSGLKACAHDGSVVTYVRTV